jgi:hypothetical protein
LGLERLVVVLMVKRKERSDPGDEDDEIADDCVEIETETEVCRRMSEWVKETEGTWAEESQ